MSRWPASVLLGLALLGIGLATLRPEPANENAPVKPTAPFPVADSLRNLLLFAPAGAGAALLGLRPASVLAAGVALSTGIEGAQLALPGRHPSLRDVVLNAGGALLGALLVAHRQRWLRPSPVAERRAAMAALAGVLAVAAASGPLLGPAPTAAPFFGHWTPDLGHLAPYAGRLAAARVDDIAVPHGEIPGASAVRAALGGDFRVGVEGRSGPAPEGQAAFLLVTDADGTEILLLGPDRDDLVFRFRSRGRALGLEPTRVRRAGLLAPLAVGEGLRAQARRAGADLCLMLNEDERCGLGPSVADGWMLLLPGRPGLDRLRGLLGAVWIAALLAPLGYCAAPRGAGALLWIAALAALLVLPPLTGLRATPPLGLAAAVAGLLGGRGLRRVARPAAPEVAP